MWSHYFSQKCFLVRNSFLEKSTSTQFLKLIYEYNKFGKRAGLGNLAKFYCCQKKNFETIEYVKISQSYSFQDDDMSPDKMARILFFCSVRPRQNIFAQ